MAYNYRGRRVAYDNVAVGAVAGFENHIAVRTSPYSTDDASNGVTDVSQFGNTMESLTAGAGTQGTFTNIANAALPGIEDTENAGGDKLTTDGETVAD